MHERYGVDLGEPGVWDSRSWEWLRVRIEGLLNAPPLVGPDGGLIPSTRIGWQLNPPDGYAPNQSA